MIVGSDRRRLTSRRFIRQDEVPGDERGVKGMRIRDVAGNSTEEFTLQGGLSRSAARRIRNYSAVSWKYTTVT
jgi:hypothetical protein